MRARKARLLEDYRSDCDAAQGRGVDAPLIDFINTNVLVYARSEQWKASTARAVLAQGGVVSAQALNECASVLRRKAGLDWPEIAAVLDDVRTLADEVLPLTVATHERALDLAGQGCLSFYDALIVASAPEGGASRLLSEDNQAGRCLGELQIANPFA